MTDDRIKASAAMEMADAVSRDDRIFSNTVEGFLRRWAPDGFSEFTEFSTDLMNLMRHVWMDTHNMPQRRLDNLTDNLAKGNLLNPRPVMKGNPDD